VELSYPIGSDRNLNCTSFVFDRCRISARFWTVFRIDPEAFLVPLRKSLCDPFRLIITKTQDYGELFRQERTRTKTFSRILVFVRFRAKSKLRCPKSKPRCPLIHKRTNTRIRHVRVLSCLKSSPKSCIFVKVGLLTPVLVYRLNPFNFYFILGASEGDFSWCLWPS
jgi:hypothetical protein